MEYSGRFITEVENSLYEMPLASIAELARRLAELRARAGRLFILGSGGGASHASHACCDFRKLCGIECYCPSDNAAELTARVNDDGWATAYVEWLKVSNLRSRDALLVISVGGGDSVRNVSPNLSSAVEYAKEWLSAQVFYVCGRDGGDVAKMATCGVLIPAVADLTTPIVESIQAVVLHLLATHPSLQRQAAKWEGLCAP